MAIKPPAPKAGASPRGGGNRAAALMGVVAEGTGHALAELPTAPPMEVRSLSAARPAPGITASRASAPGRHLIGSRVVDRTATFVFFLGDRFFGTITAYVPGSEAAEYHFTSALAVQLLKALAPQLEPLIDAPPMSRIDDPLPRAYVVQTLPRPENSERVRRISCPDGPMITVVRGPDRFA